MATPDDLRIGADVFSQDGHKLGSLHRLVLRRRDLAVTAVVVDVGLLRSGHSLWEALGDVEHDRVVPVEAVESARHDRIELNLTARAFKDTPDYTDDVYESASQDLSPNEFDLSDVVNRSYQIGSALGSAPGGWLVERLNKPLDAVDIAEGTPVWRQHPHQKLGEVKHVLLDDGGRVKAFVIERGFILTRDVVLPVRYVTELLDDIVRVDVLDEEIDRLLEYRG